jgi:hypothetical protein
MAAAVVLLGRAMSDQRPVVQLVAEIALGAVIYGILLLIFGRQRLKEPLEMAKALKR